MFSQIDTPSLKEHISDYKPNASFMEAYQLLDSIKEQKDLDEAIEKLKASDSFHAYYALGELYRDGRCKSINKTPVLLDPDKSLASQFFLKAYESHKEKIKVNIDQTDPISPLSYQEVTLTHVENLSRKAEKGNAEALYQLACFFQQEQLSGSQKKTSLLPDTLSKFEKACLVAAADFFHPHAAYILATKAKDEEEKLRYSTIAADPCFALQQLLIDKESRILIEVRGDRVIQDSITLQAPNNTLPIALIQTQAIHSKKMGGLYASTCHYQKMASILPFCYSANTGHSLGGEVADSKEEMRKMRAARFSR